MGDLALARDPRGIPTSLTAALLQLEHALTAAEISREQVVEISAELRKETSARFEVERQAKRLREENSVLAKRIGELATAAFLEADVIVALALRRKDLSTIRPGDSLYVTADGKKSCVLCGRSFGIRNGLHAVDHGRSHLGVNVTEAIRKFDSRLRFEFDLTEAGAVVANARMEKAS